MRQESHVFVGAGNKLSVFYFLAQITVISPFEIEYDSASIRQIKLTGMFAHLEGT